MSLSLSFDFYSFSPPLYVLPWLWHYGNYRRHFRSVTNKMWRSRHLGTITFAVIFTIVWLYHFKDSWPINTHAYVPIMYVSVTMVRSIEGRRSRLATLHGNLTRLAHVPTYQVLNNGTLTPEWANWATSRVNRWLIQRKQTLETSLSNMQNPLLPSHLWSCLLIESFSIMVTEGWTYPPLVVCHNV